MVSVSLCSHRLITRDQKPLAIVIQVQSAICEPPVGLQLFKHCLSTVEFTCCCSLSRLNDDDELMACTIIVSKDCTNTPNIE